MRSIKNKSKGSGLSQSLVDNPFESRGVFHKRHHVFNRRVKGEKRNVARARGQATQRRKQTLLVDYQRDKKDNTFQDRRFGEDDADLELEEKMWKRMQKERKRRGGKAGMFNLEDDPVDDFLTHRGQVLNDDLSASGIEEEDDDLGAEVVDRLHFGGGDTGSDLQRKDGVSRQEMLNDIIAKSKERKIEKARGKEVQESERERLDQGISELMGMLNTRVPKHVKTHSNSAPDEYDTAMREFAYEARAQATDRLQTTEEAARAEKARLDALEEARLKRMNHQVSDSETETTDSRKRRRDRKGRNDEELDEESDILAKVTPTAYLEENDGDSAIEESDIFYSDSEGSTDEGASQIGSDAASDCDSDSSSSSGAKADQVPRETSQTLGAEIPYVLPCPATYEDLLALLAKHAHAAGDINTIIDRIHKNHSIKLDSRNKEQMHNFFDILLKRFRRVGDQCVPMSSDAHEDRSEQLDFLTRLIFDIATEMPEVAASLAHRFVGSLHQRTSKGLADLAVGGPSSECWPSKGSQLLLKLLVQIFPSSDFRHPVVTPILLYLSRCLALSPMRSTCDLSAGIYSCTLVLHCCLSAGRFSPETLAFLTSTLALFVPERNKQEVRSVSVKRKALLEGFREAASAWNGEDFPLFQIGADQKKSLSGYDPAYAAGLLGAVYKITLRMVECLRGTIAFAEICIPLRSVLDKMQPEEEPALPKAAHVLNEKLRRVLMQGLHKCALQRKPLQWRATKSEAIVGLVPKFQEDYKLKKDGHKDPEKLKLKHLQQQVKRERKGAARELKRDALFLEHAKAEERIEKEHNRKRRFRDNLSWLEEQQATLNQQVKLGGKLIKGGGSSSSKRARVGRGW